MYNSLGGKMLSILGKGILLLYCKKNPPKPYKQFHYSFKKSERERPTEKYTLKQVSSDSGVSD